MEIRKIDYKWNGKLLERNHTRYIVLHHRAGEGDAESIHKQHLSKGYTGIGYHFYVRKNGEVYKGRPIGTVGAHTIGANDISVGVCFEGNFETDKDMPTKQQKSGKWLVGYLKKLYPDAKVVRHKDLQSTACPGKNFPYDKIKEGEKSMTLEDAIEIVQLKAGLEDETIEFLLCYKYGEELMVKLAEAIR